MSYNELMNNKVKKNINKELFGQRLKELMNNYGETTYSLGNILNLSPPTISRYTRGEMLPKMTTLKALSSYFNVNEKYLTGESSSIYDDSFLTDTNSDKSQIPIFESVKYDLPIFSNKKLDSFIKVPNKNMINWGPIIAIRMPDDSMSPTIEKGDTLVVRLNPQITDMNLAALHINRQDLIVRKLKVSGNRIILQPSNLDHDVEIYNLNKDNIQIIGNVVYRSHTEEEYFD